MVKNSDIKAIIELIKNQGGTIHYNGGDPEVISSYAFGLSGFRTDLMMQTESLVMKMHQDQRDYSALEPFRGPDVEIPFKLHDFGQRGNTNSGTDIETAIKYSAEKAQKWFDKSPVNVLVDSLDKHNDVVNELFEKCVQEGIPMNINYDV